MGTVAELEKVRKKRSRALFFRRLAVLCIIGLIVLGAFYITQGGAVKVVFGQVADGMMAFLAGDSMPVTLSSNRPQWMSDVSGRIALADNDSLTIYTRSGRQIESHALGYQNPAFRASGPRVLAYDVGGSRFDLFFWDDRRVSMDTGETIYCADLAPSGLMVIGGSESTALSGVRVYAEDKQETFRWKSSELMVSAVALSQSGGRVAFSGISTVGGEVYSSVSIYRIDRKEPVAQVRLPGEVVLALGYGANGVLALSNQRVTLIGENGQVKTSYTFTSSPVAFALSDQGQVGLVLGDYDDSHTLTVTLLGSDLRVQGSWDVAGQVNHLGYGSDGFYVVSGEQYTLYSSHKEPVTVRVPEGILALPGRTIYYATPTQLKKVSMP